MNTMSQNRYGRSSNIGFTVYHRHYRVLFELSFSYIVLVHDRVQFLQKEVIPKVNGDFGDCLIKILFLQLLLSNFDLT
jgi:hypothetical protein